MVQGCDLQIVNLQVARTLLLGNDGTHLVFWSPLHVRRHQLVLLGHFSRGKFLQPRKLIRTRRRHRTISFSSMPPPRSPARCCRRQINRLGTEPVRSAHSRGIRDRRPLRHPVRSTPSEPKSRHHGRRSHRCRQPPPLTRVRLPLPLGPQPGQHPLRQARPGLSLAVVPQRRVKPLLHSLFVSLHASLPADSPAFPSAFAAPVRSATARLPR